MSSHEISKRPDVTHSIMDCHYDISQDEMEAHPSMRILREQNALTIYGAAYKQGRDFLCSTSGWTAKHLEALKVIEFANFPLDRLCPGSYAISATSNLAQQVRNTFSLPAEDVKAGRYDMMSITNWFYTELSNLLRTDRKTPSPLVKHIAPKRAIIPFTFISPPDKDPDTILGMSFGSTSDDTNYSPIGSPLPNSPKEEADIREIVTNNMVVAFMSILANLAYPERNPTKSRPEFLIPSSLRFMALN
jgi:hypothetical protein